MNNIIIKRVIAFYLDAFFSIILVFPIWYLFKPDPSFDGEPSINSLGIFQLGMMLVYYYFSELKFNTTIGKKIMKLKVVFIEEKGNALSIILIRTICRLIPFDLFSFIFNSNGQTWHDKFSKTKVLHRE